MRMLVKMLQIYNCIPRVSYPADFFRRIKFNNLHVCAILSHIASSLNSLLAVSHFTQIQVKILYNQISVVTIFFLCFNTYIFRGKLVYGCKET